MTICHLIVLGKAPVGETIQTIHILPDTRTTAESNLTFDRWPAETPINGLKSIP